jgi:hypothetical protein
VYEGRKSHGARGVRRSRCCDLARFRIVLLKGRSQSEGTAEVEKWTSAYTKRWMASCQKSS